MKLHFFDVDLTIDDVDVNDVVVKLTDGEMKDTIVDMNLTTIDVDLTIEDVKLTSAVVKLHIDVAEPASERVNDLRQFPFAFIVQVPESDPSCKLVLRHTPSSPADPNSPKMGMALGRAQLRSWLLRDSRASVFAAAG